MAAKRTCGRYVTPFNCISGDFVSVVLVVSFWLFRWFRWFCSGGFVSVFRVLVHAEPEMHCIQNFQSQNLQNNRSSHMTRRLPL